MCNAFSVLSNHFMSVDKDKVTDVFQLRVYCATKHPSFQFYQLFSFSFPLSVAQFVVSGRAGDHPADVQYPIPAPVSLQIPPGLYC